MLNINVLSVCDAVNIHTQDTDSSTWLETNYSSAKLFFIVSSNQKPVHVLSLPQKKATSNEQLQRETELCLSQILACDRNIFCPRTHSAFLSLPMGCKWCGGQWRGEGAGGSAWTPLPKTVPSHADPRARQKPYWNERLISTNSSINDWPFPI